jgi:hypothetical protein
VINNRFGPNITAEHIDIKEGTYGGLIQGNYFDGVGMTGENWSNCWVNVKGTNYTVINNTGNKSIGDGIKVSSIYSCFVLILVE